MTIIYEHGTRSVTHHQGPFPEFDSALAAFRCGDFNPIRLYLGLPLKTPCDDCGEETTGRPHGKEVLCVSCFVDRESFLDQVYREEVV